MRTAIRAAAVVGVLLVAAQAAGAPEPPAVAAVPAGWQVAWRAGTLEGLKAAVARGRKGGRRKALSEGDLEVGRALLAAGNISIAEIAKRLGVSRMTFYTYFPQARTRSQALKG